MKAVHVGTLEVGLAVHAAQSLKDRRRSVESLKRRIRNTFNAAVADLDDDPIPGRARIGVTCVSNDPRRLDAQMRAILEFIERVHLDLEVTDDQIEIIHL